MQQERGTARKEVIEGRVARAWRHCAQVEGCGLPRQLLSAAAAATPLEDLEKAARAEQGHALHFTDVAPSADLHRCAARMVAH